MTMTRHARERNSLKQIAGEWNHRRNLAQELIGDVLCTIAGVVGGATIAGTDEQVAITVELEAATVVVGVWLIDAHDRLGGAGIYDIGVQ